MKEEPIKCDNCRYRPMVGSHGLCAVCAAMAGFGKVDDVLVKEMAKLTRSIDGLRGSVDKLNEAMEPDVVTTSMSREEAQRAMNELRSDQVEILAVKRGPITPLEIEQACDAAGVHCEGPNIGCVHNILERFASQRGLL